VDSALFDQGVSSIEILNRRIIW